MGWPILKVLALACLSLFVPLWVAAQTGTSVSHGLLLVANKGNRTLGIIDPEAGREVAEVPEGGITGHEVAASQNGQMACVSCMASGKIAAINLKTWNVEMLIDAGPQADGLAWAPQSP